MMNNQADNSLLAADSLAGVRIAVSASESPDLARLGLVEAHFRLTLAEIARSVLVSGGKLSYGGHLDPDGYAALLIQELHRYSRRDRPLQICLAWEEHRKLSRDEFEIQKKDLGLFGEIVCLDPDGKVIEFEKGRQNEPEPVTDISIIQRSLTGLRHFMASQSGGRVLIGGKRKGFQGILPGVLEEALISFNASQPLYLVGGFGGVTADIVGTLKIDDGRWLPPKIDSPPPDVRLISGLERIAKSFGHQELRNGLTEIENRRLAATHRPSEIAALVSLGLGRRYAASRKRKPS